MHLNALTICQGIFFDQKSDENDGWCSWNYATFVRWRIKLFPVYCCSPFSCCLRHVTGGTTAITNNSPRLHSVKSISMMVPVTSVTSTWDFSPFNRFFFTVRINLHFQHLFLLGFWIKRIFLIFLFHFEDRLRTPKCWWSHHWCLSIGEDSFAWTLRFLFRYVCCSMNELHPSVYPQLYFPCS